jgi:hypothetical protein
MKGIGRSKKDELGPLKRRGNVGRGGVNAGEQGSFPDDRGAQKKIDLPGQTKYSRSAPQLGENIVNMPQFGRIAASGQQAGKPKTRLRVLNHGCPAIG